MGLSYSSHSEGKLDESDLMNTNTDSTHLESSQQCRRPQPHPTAEQSRAGLLKRELCLALPWTFSRQRHARMYHDP